MKPCHATTADQVGNKDDDDLEKALSMIKGIVRTAKKRRLSDDSKAATNEETKTLMEEKAALERALENIKQELEKSQDDYRKCENEKAAMEKTVESTREQLKESQDECRRLNSDLTGKVVLERTLEDTRQQLGQSQIDYRKAQYDKLTLEKALENTKYMIKQSQITNKKLESALREQKDFSFSLYKAQKRFRLSMQKSEKVKSVLQEKVRINNKKELHEKSQDCCDKLEAVLGEREELEEALKEQRVMLKESKEQSATTDNSRNVRSL